jgi:chromatin remodeling complex protein RSC6
MNLNNSQLSFIITFLIMSLVALTLFNISLQGMQEPEYLFELAMDEELLEEIPQEEQEKMPDEVVKSHMAFNKAVKSQFEEELKEFKTLEELIEDAKNTENDDSENTYENSNESSEETQNESENELLTSAGGGGAVTSKSEIKKRSAASKGDNTTDKVKNANVFRRNTTISYSLKDRMHLKLPNPIYTCEQNGKIVINIKVDRYGNVLEASHNKASSNSSNGCLVDNAIAYALRSKFEEGTKDNQLGTITYSFQNH